MILGIYIFKELGLYLKCSNRSIGRGDGPFESCTSHMANLGTYEFKI